VVAGVADRVVVMYAGRPVETSVVDEIFYHPRHPYTIGLMASLPRLDAAGARTERLYRIKGQPPSLIFLPSGCPFHPRCEFAELPAPCSTIRPDLELVDHTYGRHMAACHRRHDMADVNPDELHADAGAELEAVEDAAVITPAEAKAMEQLSVPTEEQE
jgi:oligopeptide/dipeptide ABC transporter ATP-binding protein